MTVLAVDALLLFGAVSVGLSIPEVRVLDPLAERSRLQYGGRVNPLSGLSPSFVAAMLGGEVGAERPREGPRAPLLEPGTVPQATGSGDGIAPPNPADQHPPTNDDFEDARAVASIPYEARTTTNAATRETGEPASCGPVGGTLWYRFTADDDLGLIADTFGSDHPTTIAVFSGRNLRALDELACHRHPLGFSLVPFQAVAGRSYHFQVSAPTQIVNPAVGGGGLVFRLAAQGVTELASIGKHGPGNGPSEWPSMSANGRYVAFRSGASNLDPRFPGILPCEYGHLCGQMYVHDVVTRGTAMVSISSQGEPGDAPSGLGGNTSGRTAVLSRTGRFVAFTSNATNLTPGDTNVCPAPTLTFPAVRPGTCADVFLHDRDADGDGRFDEDPRREPGAVSTEFVSASSRGEQGDGASDSPSISADGRHIAFASRAGNLVRGDTLMCKWRDTVDPPLPDYNCIDVFVHDRLTGKTIPASVSSTGRQGNGDSGGGNPSLDGVGLSISADGQHVAFVSGASNLVPGDRNGKRDVFVHSLDDGRTTRVSTSPGGREANWDSAGPALSADGRYVAFHSGATNLVPGDGNGVGDVFVRDRDADGDARFDEAGTLSTVVASVSSTGRPGARGSYYASISSDGRYVAFLSAAPNLVPGDRNRTPDGLNAFLPGEVGVDVFVRDLHRGLTIRVSISSEGAESRVGGASFPAAPGISADGRTFAWDSAADDLTEDDDHAVAGEVGHAADRLVFDVYVHRLTWR